MKSYIKPVAWKIIQKKIKWILSVVQESEKKNGPRGADLGQIFLHKRFDV
jgi:hypothetical protein